MLVFSFGESQPAASGRADGEGDDVAGSKDGIPEPNLKGDVPRDVKRLQPLKRGGDNALYVVLRVDDLLMRHGIHLPSAPLRRGFFYSSINQIRIFLLTSYSKKNKKILPTEKS